MRIPPQPWMTSIPAVRVMTALEGARPACARFVGGCVRDALMGRAVSDIDIATQLLPAEVSRVMRAAGVAVHETGIEHGTLTVVADHQPFEVTTLRRDVETDGRRATVAFTEDWAEDAGRRDFRMNALYCDLDGELFDPTGGGLRDVGERRVIFVGDPETRIREDYLRILRFFRFSAWFSAPPLDPDGLAACGRLAGGLKGLSAERVWSETKKMLAAPDPRLALGAMQGSGVFSVLYPWALDAGLLERLIALDLSDGTHPDPMLRVLALAGRDPGAVTQAVRDLKLSNDEARRLRLGSARSQGVRPGISDLSLHRELYLSPEGVLRDWARLDQAQEPENTDWRELLRRIDSWIRPTFPVTGADLLAAGIQPGPEFGAALKRLESAWVESGFVWTREQLLGRLAAK